jgi:hypothetical protein
MGTSTCTPGLPLLDHKAEEGPGHGHDQRWSVQLNSGKPSNSLQCSESSLGVTLGFCVCWCVCGCGWVGGCGCGCVSLVGFF